jgi:DNA-binding IclR family transcriptional regulator
MKPRRDEIDTPTLRAALVAVRVMADPPWEPTTAEVAALLHIDHSTAYRLMARLSYIFGLYQEPDGARRWRRI